MKEFKILAVVIALVAVTYYGIEPYAHHVMHPTPAPADFKFKDLKNLDVNIQGDAVKGKELVTANCTGCHSIEAAGFPKLMPNADSAAAYGVVPPDLSSSGHIYETNYLANFIFDPVSAMKLEHKFPVGGAKAFPMPAYNWMPAQDIMDMVAYLQSIPKAKAEGKEANKLAFEAACVRCHSMGYAGIEMETPADVMYNYIGANPPDLSQYIKSRGRTFLNSFLNDPQYLLHGTGMPRVGLTAEAQEQVITYMEQIGDSKKQEREALGVKVILFMLVFAILALLWKKQIWRDIQH